VVEEKTAFTKYLETMPGGEYLKKCDPDTEESCTPDGKELNPLDAFECGRAREYFGFDEYFINDEHICRDINQFRNTRDFEFLEEFFKQGSGIEAEPNSDVFLVPPLVLVPPKTGKHLYEFRNGKNLEWLFAFRYLTP
jgi:hypothetical protein